MLNTSIFHISSLTFTLTVGGKQHPCCRSTFFSLSRKKIGIIITFKQKNPQRAEPLLNDTVYQAVTHNFNMHLSFLCPQLVK